MRSQYRIFHNYVKSTLLQRNRPRYSLLDFGCGFGGDINKWMQCKVMCVVGVDPNADSIEEARRRLGSSNLFCNFVHAPDPVEFVQSLPDKCVDVITFHFAIHYYSREGQRDVLRELHRVLADGGTLIVTFLDAKKVLNYASNPVLRIQMVSAYQIDVSMNESVYFDSIGGVSREYLCFSTYLFNEAKYFRQRELIPFQDFYPKWTGTLTRDEMAASFLHVALILKR